MSKTEVSGKQIKDGSIELVDLSNAVATDISTLKSDVATLQTDVAAKADAGNLASVATSGSYDDLTNKPNIPSLSGYATEAYVDGAVSGLVNSAPATLDTLKELSDALGADANFATTVAGQIGDIASDVSALDGRVTATEGDISSLQSDVSLLQNSVSAGTNIGDLNGVAITSPSAGQVLTYNGLGWVNGAAPSSFSGSYNDLTDKPTLFSGSYVDLTNKPTIPTNLDSLTDVTASSPSAGEFLIFNGTAWVNGNVTQDDVVGLSEVGITGSYADLIDKPTLFDGAYSSLTGAPSLATVATSGSYADLSNKPTLFSGSYTDLTNKPTLASFTTLTSPASGQYLRYNGSAWVNSAIQGADLPVANGSTAGIVSAGDQVFNGRKQLFGGATIKAPWVNQVALFLQSYSASQTADLVVVQNLAGNTVTTIQPNGTIHAIRYTETVANAFNTSLAPSSGTLTVDTSVGNAVLGALSASVTTWAFTNVPTDNSKITTVTAVLAGNASFTYGDACSVNGSAVSGGIRWSGGSAPTATANTDIITFVIVRDSAGTIRVFGSATTNFS
jgi:hypothetical protein